MQQSQTPQQTSWAPAPTAGGSFLDLRDYGNVVRRRWKLIASCIAIAIGLAVVWTTLQTRVYTASTKIFVQPATNLDPPINVEDEQQKVLSIPVATAAAALLGQGADPTALLKHVDVASDKSSSVLQIRFEDSDPARAAAGAEEFSKAYFQVKSDDAQAAIDAQVKSVQEQIDELPGLANAEARAALENTKAQYNATIINPGYILVDATVPSSPTSPNLVFNIILAAFLGGVLGLVLAFVRERLDDRLRGRADLEEVLGAPVITMIPQVPSWRDQGSAHLVTMEAPRSPAAEAYRTLRTSILVAAAEQGYKTLMVVSALAGEGKTTTAANLAVVLAQADKRVVLISADLRRPRLHEFFGLGPSERGLSEVLEGNRKAWESLRSGRVDNLWIMASGHVSEQPTELLQSEAMRELLADQREVVDFIIVDCPPVLAVADALVLAPLADAILYVANEQVTPRGAVVAARAQLDQVGAHLLGGVLNDVQGSGRGYEYYGQYSYHQEPQQANGTATTWNRLRKNKSQSA